MKVVSRRPSSARQPQTTNAAPFFSKERSQQTSTHTDNTPFFSSSIGEPMLQMLEEPMFSGKKKKIQRQTIASGASDAPEDNNAPSSLESRINNSKNGGTPLPENTKSNMDNAFGTDFSAVKVHTDQEAVQMNQDLNAKAFTHGSDIYFNEGKFDPHSPTGQHLLAHELTHVVQQGGTNNAKQESSTGAKDVSATSPKVQRSILDDIGEYLTIGIDFFHGVVDGIIEWFGDLFSGIASLIRQAFQGDTASLIAVAGIIIVIILAVFFPEVVIPVLIGFGIIMGFISMIYFLYMMTRPGLTAYERGKFLGKAIVEAALLALTLVEAIRFVQAFAQVGRLTEGVGLLQKLRFVRRLLRFGQTAKVLEILAEIGDIQKTIDFLTIVNDVSKAYDLMALARGAGGVDILLDLLRIPGVTADDIFEFMHFAGMTLPDLRALVRTPGMTLDNLRILLGTEHMTVEILRELLGRPAVTVQNLLEILARPGMTVPDLRSLLATADMTMEKLQQLLAFRTMTVEILKDLLLRPGVTVDNLINMLSRPGMTVSSLIELFSADGMTMSKLENLLAVGGMTINELKALLGRPGMTTDILSDLLRRPGMTLGDLRDLLGRTGMTPADLQELLSRAGMTVPDLKDLLALADDVPQLRTLLTLVPDIPTLKRYFTLAGGHGHGTGLLNVLQKAHALGDIRRAEDLLTIANGSATKFTQLTTALNKFGLATASGASPVAPHGYSGFNFRHFRARHTYEFFDFAGAIEAIPIKPKNTLWSLGTDVITKVEEALAHLDAQTPPLRISPFPAPATVATLSDGTRVKMGCNSANFMTMFHPLENLSAGVITFREAEMLAFKKLLLP